MKLSFSTNAFVKFSVPEAIRIIAETGYSGVEILADMPHLYPFSTTERDIVDVKAALEVNGLQAANINANTAVGYYGAKFWEPLFEPSLANPDRNARKWRVEYTKKCIDMAHSLACRSISVTSGRMVPGVSPEKSLEYLRESLFEVLDYASARGVRVGMEYEPGLLVENSEELRVLIDGMGAENFGANLDLGHSHLLGERPAEVIGSLAARIFHLHLEDIRDKKHYHLIPGEGNVNFHEIRDALDEIGYEGYATVELYTYPESPGLAAERAFSFLDKLHKGRNKR